MTPLVALDRISVAFGHLPLLDAVSMQVQAGDRIGVLGRNGTGKSTLLRVISGEQQPDAGTVWRAAGVRVARLEQDVPLAEHRTAFEVVADGLGALSALVRAYHAAAVAAVHHYFRGRHQAQGQALYTSLSFGAGGALGAVASGYT